MEDHVSSTRPHGSALEQFAESIQSARARAHEVLVAQRERLLQMENELARHMQTVAERLEHDRQDLDTQHTTACEQSVALDQQRLALLSDQSEWEQAREETFQKQQALAEQLQEQLDNLEQREAELRARAEALQAKEEELHQVQRRYKAAQQELTEQSADVARARRRLEEKEQSLDNARDQLEQEQIKTKSQRRRIARELREQRQELQREREHLNAAVRRHEQHQTQEAEQHQQLEAALDQADSERQELQRQVAALEEQLRNRPASPGDEEELAKLRTERSALVERLAEAEAKLKTPPSDSELQRKIHDLQRRFEMALEDLRALKLENSELKEELTEARRAAQQHPSPRPTAQDGPLDWEAQKQRLLAALEADFDDEDEEQRQERLTIEGAIHITDEVVAEREREIKELKQLLDEQSSNLGGMAVGAAAIAAALDQDELIREERERLTALKAEWEEKLRQAEIDLSVERAQLARQKAELEAKAETLQSEWAKIERQADPNKSDKGGRGRWLARLGLSESDERKK